LEATRLQTLLSTWYRATVRPLSQFSLLLNKIVIQQDGCKVLKALSSHVLTNTNITIQESMVLSHGNFMQWEALQNQNHGLIKSQPQGNLNMLLVLVINATKKASHLFRSLSISMMALNIRSLLMDH